MLVLLTADFTSANQKVKLTMPKSGDEIEIIYNSLESYKFLI